MGDIMQQQLTQALEAYLQKLDDEARIEAINAFRQVLHHYSPFRSQPVDCVLWVKQELVAPNDYNPNNVAPPEKRLLQTSLEADGFTQPVVVIQQRPQAYTIVDGFHRHELACSKAVLKKTLKGYLPVTCLTSDAASRDGLMAATIRHNRARGRHQIHAMSEIVRELTRLGWTPQKIGKELGMDADEVLRLKQISGLTECSPAASSPRRGRLSNYSWHKRAAAASRVAGCLAKHKRISLCGNGSAQKTESGIAATPISVVNQRQKLTSSRSEMAL